MTVPTDTLARARRLQFGASVRRHRTLLRLSQEELAVRAGVDRKTVNRIENGVHALSLDRLWRIADALEIDVRMLFDDVATEHVFGTVPIATGNLATVTPISAGALV